MSDSTPIESGIENYRRRITKLRKQRDWFLDVLISRWHESDSDLNLHEWLDWTQEQYMMWLETPSQFPQPPQAEV